MSGGYQAPRFEVLKTLAEIAEETRRPLRTIRRQLVAVHRTDVEKDRGGWLFRVGRRKWLVNPSALRQAHPEFFETKYFSRDEAAVLQEDVQTIKARVNDLQKALNATRARLREALGVRKTFAQEA